MWLLEASIRQAIEQAYSSGLQPTAEQQAQYAARFLADDSSAPRLLTVAGDVAEIAVSGVITKAPSFLAMLFGGGNVTYPDIISALAEADRDPAVSRVEMRVDSPGGQVDGLFEAIAALQALSKPLKAVVHNRAASAAYALVSQADEIVAANKAASFGSIGVVISARIDDNNIDITSTNAPKKRPDVRTEEGVAMVREELDALHEIFVEAIATGRGATPEKINAEFGQGATLLAGEALKRGMIDSIAGAPPLRVVKTAAQTQTASGGNSPESVMDLKTLKAQHPDVYAAAMQDGIEQERERTGAHLIMGEASGDMATALKAISEGTAMTATLNAKYMAAGLNRRDMQNRQDDDAAAAAAADGAHSDEGGQDASDLVCSAVERKLSIGAEAV